MGLEVVGQTEDGVKVIGNWFDMVTTFGVPMTMVVENLNEKGFMPDWLDFYLKAISSGWKAKRTINRLRAAVGDVYGLEFANEWETRFHETLNKLEELKNEQRRDAVIATDERTEGGS